MIGLTLENRISSDENGEVNRGLIIEGLEDHGKEFSFYLQDNREPLNDFR